MIDKTCKQCKGPVTGKQRFCSDKCRMRWNRTSNVFALGLEVGSGLSKPNKVVAPNRTESQPELKRTVPVLLRIKGNPTDEQLLEAADRRTNPELINWAKWMNADELEAYRLAHGLDKYHNRSPIPGDWDYVGVAC